MVLYSRPTTKYKSVVFRIKIMYIVLFVVFEETKMFRIGPTRIWKFYKNSASSQIVNFFHCHMPLVNLNNNIECESEQFRTNSILEVIIIQVH